MADFSLLQYLYLKIVITLSRWSAYPFMRSLFKAPNSNRTLIQIPSRDPTRFIKAWIHRPPNHSESTLGLLINWHGTPVEDVEDVLKWAEDQPDRFDLSRIAVSGFSAGGNLALVAASELRGHFKRINIKAAYAFYPLVDLDRNPGLKKVPNPINPFPVFSLRLFATCYMPRAEERTNPRVSPTFADPALFPDTTIIITCSADNLSPEAEEMGQKLKAGGANVEVVQLENAAHGFDKDAKPGSDAFKQREMAYLKVAEDLRKP
ncbi:hypothetical protein NW754_008665 [Fusarium falciforme]|nr:hypothetical protein NW754_008665 [Fusarium falciforme]